MTTALLNIDIETTCTLTKLLAFDSANKSPFNSCDINNMSNMASSRHVGDYYAAISSIDTNFNYSSPAGHNPDHQNSASIPIWRQPLGAMVTPGGRIVSNATSATGFSYSNQNGIHTAIGSIKTNPSEQSSARYAAAASTPTGGVNATSCIPLQHLNTCYAYALDRGNGQYTRLVPADYLGALKYIPQFQGPAGLIILPTPRGSSPGVPHSVTEYTPAPSVIGDGRPSSRSNDTVQTTIDSIVAKLPPAPKKRVKVYCDNWLHKGECAFEQQGCKYKHVMPLDKETQMSVGLFNGLPTWYCRTYCVDSVGGPLGSKSPGSGGSYSPHSDRGSFIRGGSWRGGRSSFQLSPAPKSGSNPQGPAHQLPSQAVKGYLKGTSMHSARQPFNNSANGRPNSGVGSQSNSYAALCENEQDAGEIDDDDEV